MLQLLLSYKILLYQKQIFKQFACIIRVAFYILLIGYRLVVISLSTHEIFTILIETSL